MKKESTVSLNGHQLVNSCSVTHTQPERLFCFHSCSRPFNELQSNIHSPSQLCLALPLPLWEINHSRANFVQLPLCPSQAGFQRPSIRSCCPLQIEAGVERNQPRCKSDDRSNEVTEANRCLAFLCPEEPSAAAVLLSSKGGCCSQRTAIGGK